MSDSKKDIDADINAGLDFTEEGKLRHENKFLHERVVNLEVFKKTFFSTHAELIKANEKLALLEQMLELEKLKKSITGLPDPLDAEGAEAAKTNDTLLDFFKESFSADAYLDVVSSIFHSVDGMELDVAVQISLKNQVLDHSFDESNKDESIQLINQYKSQGEMVEDDDYIVFNLSNISLLARQLPVKNFVKCQQIKDFLQIVTVGANSRINFLYMGFEHKTLQENIYKIFQKTRMSFEKMQENMDAQIMSTSELFLKLEEEVVQVLIKMKVSEDDMNLAKLIMHDRKTELNLLLTSGLTMDEDFLNTIIKLERAYAIKYAGKK